MNNHFGISEKSFKLLTDAFHRFPDVDKVLIFGSRAKGNYKQGSDIDLAIFGPNCSPLIALEIEAYLNEGLSIPYYIDVVDYQSLDNLELRGHIDRAGKIFYEIMK